MLGTTMILMGLVLMAGSIVAGYFMITLGCSKGELAGCDAGAIKLISELMIANEGIFFWLAWVAGVFLIWGGLRLRERSGR